MLDGFPVRGVVRAPESIDRLLRVAHDEEAPRLEAGRVGVGRTVVPTFGEKQNDFVLDRIGVLELVNEDHPETAFQGSADGGIVAKQVARANEEPVEVDEPRSRL